MLLLRFRNVLITTLLIVCQTKLFGQGTTSNLLGPSGGHAELTTSGIVLDWTLGEIAIDNTRLVNGSVKMGFLQSRTLMAKNNGLVTTSDRITCYPNPVTRRINLVCENWDNAALRIEVKNPSMETVLPGQSYSKVNRKVVLDLTLLPGGPYFIIISNLKNKTTMSLAIIKIN